MITSSVSGDECNGRFSIIKIASFKLTVVLSFEQQGKGDRGCVSLGYALGIHLHTNVACPYSSRVGKVLPTCCAEVLQIVLDWLLVKELSVVVSVLCYQDGMLWHRLQLQGRKCPSSQAHRSRSMTPIPIGLSGVLISMCTYIKTLLKK